MDMHVAGNADAPSPGLIGRRAVVVGAGFAGLAAAAALARRFEEVVVLERDELPASAVQRAGIPQGPARSCPQAWCRSAGGGSPGRAGPRVRLPRAAG